VPIENCELRKRVSRFYDSSILFKLIPESTTKALCTLVGIGMLARLLVQLGSIPVLWPDSLNYLQTADSIVNFGRMGSHHFYFTPLYPIFLSGFLLFAPIEYASEMIVAAQHIIGLALVCIFYVMARRFFESKIAFLAALLLNLHVLLLYYENVIQTEAMFVFLLMLLLFFTLRGRDNPRVWKFFCIGILTGILSLCRPIAQFFPVIFCIYAVLCSRNLKQRILGAIAVACGFLFLITPWLVVQTQVFGVPTISLGKGLNLFLRVYEVEKIPVKEDTRFKRIKKIFEETRAKSNKKYVYFKVRNKIAKDLNKRAAAVDDLMFRFALEGLYSHPTRFALGTVKQLGDYFFNPRESIRFCKSGSRAYLCSQRGVALFHWAFFKQGTERGIWAQNFLRFFFRYFSLPSFLLSGFALLGIVSVLWNCRLDKDYFLLMMIIAYFAVVSCLLNVPQDRYRLPIDPILILFGAEGLLLLLQIVPKLGRIKQANLTA